MRILSLSLGVAAIACVVAQAADPLAASNSQENYAWAPEANQDDLASLIEEQLAPFSEFEFRAQILNSLDELNSKDKSKLQAEDLSCDITKLVIKTGLATALATANAASANASPSLAIPLYIVKFALQGISGISDLALEPQNVGLLIGINLALTTAITALGVVNVGPLKTYINPLLTALSPLQYAIQTLIKCSKGTSKIEFESAQCNEVANMYRGAVTETIKTTPASNLPADASDDLRRLVTGSVAVLDLMEKFSIASANDALLTSHPVFAADVLEQYRDELLRVASTEDIKAYAQAGLGSVIGISNALEACLRVAADPVAAADELNEELTTDEEEEDEENEE